MTVQSVTTESDLPPDVSLNECTGPVGSDIAACPSRTLIEKLDVVLQRGFDLTLLVVLDPSFPSIRDEPACDKVVVIRIELILPPPLRLESF